MTYQKAQARLLKELHWFEIQKIQQAVQSDTQKPIDAIDVELILNEFRRWLHDHNFTICDSKPNEIPVSKHRNY